MPRALLATIAAACAALAAPVAAGAAPATAAVRVEVRGAAPGLSAVRADAVRDLQWHLAALGLPAAHLRSRGAGVVVAVVDSGVDGNHPDLRDNVVSGYDVTAPDGDSAGLVDQDGRGTGLAGIIAAHGHADESSPGPTVSPGAVAPSPEGPDAAGNEPAGILGVAPAARVMPIVFAPRAGEPGDPDRLAEGINAAVRRGAQIICIGRGVADSERLRAAVTDAVARGVIVVATRGVAPYPAGYAGVQVAQPTDRNGRALAPVAAGVWAVPGVDIVTTNTRGGSRIDTGGSAAAVLAGLIALVKAAFPTLPADEIMHRLTQTARGSVPDVNAALTRPVPLRNPPPATPSAGPGATPTASAAPTAAGPAPSAVPPPPVGVVPAFESRDWRRWLVVLPLVIFLVGFVALMLRTPRRVGRPAR